ARSSRRTSRTPTPSPSEDAIVRPRLPRASRRRRRRRPMSRRRPAFAVRRIADPSTRGALRRGRIPETVRTARSSPVSARSRRIGSPRRPTAPRERRRARAWKFSKSSGQRVAACANRNSAGGTPMYLRVVKIETFALERWMTRWETKTPYDIAESGIFPLTMRELLDLQPPESRDATLLRLLGLRLGYSEACGSAELRTLLAGTYRQTGPEEILVTTGAIEANFLLFNVLLSPGDHIIAVHPAYQQLFSVPRALGCEVSLWRLREEDGFRFDLDALERLVTSRTRLIVINSPHKPTGAMLSEEELLRIDRLAGSVGARVLSDEAYRWLEIPGGTPHPRPMRDLGSASVSVGTLSKPFGLPGLRIGWIAGPADLVSKCWAMRDY